MNFILTIPEKLTAFEVKSMLISIRELQHKDSEQLQIIFDLSHLTWIDTDGMNYIALLPYKFKILNYDVKIILPLNSEIILFLEYTTLLKFYFDNFSILNYNSLEDLMFLRQKIKSNNVNKKVRIGVVKSGSFETFLRNDLNNLEKIISHNDYSRYFCMCFYELCRNIFDHSGESTGGFSFHLLSKNKYQSEYDTLLLNISDIGIGIKESLSSTIRLPECSSDSAFIEESIKPGITSTGNGGRGYGLHQVVYFSSQVTIRSGEGVVKTQDGKLLSSLNYPTSLKGTSIFIKIFI